MFDDRIAANLGLRIDESDRRIDDGDSGQHQPFVCPFLNDRRDFGKLQSRVDSQSFSDVED